MSETTNENNSQIDFNYLGIWNGLRKNKEKVSETFKTASNHFQFEHRGAQATHIYFGYNLNTKELTFTVVAAEKDTQANTESIASATISNGKKMALPSGITGTSEISWEEANERINAWINDAQRDAWINNRFEIYQNSYAIAQAFIVRAEDLAIGNVHICYLGLNKYTANIDLIFVNSEEDVTLGNTSGSSLADLTAPVPPFQYPDEPDDLGALANI